MAIQTGNDAALSLIVPAHNEAARLGPSLLRIKEYLGKRFPSAEIIVVDDGSRDATAATAEGVLHDWPRAEVLSLPKNLGKGFSVREGVLKSKGRLVLFSDADLSTPIEELDKMIPEIERSFDVVIGSRALPGSDIRIRQSALRERMGKAFNLLVRLLVLPKIRDTQCGFKLFRREAALDVFGRLRTRGFAFDVEALALCSRLGYKVKEVPVVWLNSPPSRVRMVRSSSAMLRDLVRIWRWTRSPRFEKLYGRS